MNRRVDDYNRRRHLDAEKKKNKKRRARSVAKPFKEKVTKEGKCRNPKCHRTIRLHKICGHHIVHRSSFNPYDEERDNEDNCMPLCYPCHALYHQGKLQMSRSWLSESEQAFVVARKSSGWLDKIYPQ